MTSLRRLFSPRSIAVFGGGAAAEVVRQCQKLGFDGDIWPVHPRRAELEGLPCFPHVAALPAPPDASFIAVPREGTVQIVSDLAQRGAGGVVCYASGFAEVGGVGIDLQQQLVKSAGDMALLGPNCYGMLNYLDGVALWPDQHGGERLQRGVAIVTQSGNIGLNLTMQRRAVPLAYLITVGNKAGASIEQCVDALLEDDRVTAIGLHIEGLDDVAAFSRVALKALRLKVPLVALKSGSSVLGAQTTMSHTSSLAGPDVLYDALFARFGIARVHDPAGLLETLKFLHVHGALKGRRIISASCSGGEASMVADLAQPRGLEMPVLPAGAQQRLHAVLGDKVNVVNPLDYHTYIWGDAAAQTECFAGLLDCGFDMHLLVLDFPRSDNCNGATWQITVDAFVAAQQSSGGAASVVATLPEGLPERVARQLLQRGIAPMQGLAECLDAVQRAAMVGAAQLRVAEILPLAGVPSRVGRGEDQTSTTSTTSTTSIASDGSDVRGAAMPANGADALDASMDATLSVGTDASNASIALKTSIATGASKAAVLGLPPSKMPRMLDEAASKSALASFGLPIPRGAVVSVQDAAAYADQLGYPVVVKAVSASLAHKTEAGGVALNLQNAQAVSAAVATMAGLSDRFLVEQMASGVLAEFIVGVHRDPQFGLALTLGAGGVFVELLKDVATLLLPVSRAEVSAALGSLKTWPLVTGYRGRPAGDVDALLDAVMAVVAYAQANADRLLELDVNPLLVLPQGRGVVAVDALIRMSGEESP